MIDSDSARRDESNDMCFEAERRLVPEIASAHAHCDETHIIRFVSTSWTRIRQLRIGWLRCVRDILVFLLRMRSCPIRAQSFRSWQIQVQNVETNRMRCVSSLGDASFPRYLRFTSAHARQLRIAQPAHAQTKTPISLERSVAQRRDTCRSIRLDELHLNPRPPKRSDSNCATAHAQKQNDDIS